MKQSNLCPKCESAEIIQTRPIDRAEGMTHWTLGVATYTNPDAVVFKGKKMSGLEAWVCKSCGFVEWYAIDADKL